MQIKSIKIGYLQIPLIRPFITAVRRTDYVEDIAIIVETSNGLIGYGSAAATPLITGDSKESIIHAIKNVIAPQLINKSITEFNSLLDIVQSSIQKNTSAKAAIDIALHDLFAKSCNMPLYRLLGGNTNKINTCITISAKNTDEMVSDAKNLVKEGFKTLKIKVGLNPNEDITRIKSIRDAIDKNIKILVDANQGWQLENALEIIKFIEDSNLNIDLVEQPTKASDLTNLKIICEKSNIPIIADESCFSAEDALNIAKNHISNGVNIKLMKCGGIKNAETIYEIINTANLKCMVGCMLESPIGVTAIASFAVSKLNIEFADLDPIALIKNNPIVGGVSVVNGEVIIPDKPGLGINSITNGFSLIHEVT